MYTVYCILLLYTEWKNIFCAIAAANSDRMEINMIESIMSLKISGRCFSSVTKLQCFTKDKTRISIIYGKNGSGKSTISKAICKTESDLSCSLLDKNDNLLEVSQDHIHVFNEDYVKNKVEVQDGGLETVILLGEQVDIDKQITAAKTQLKDIENSLETERTHKIAFENIKNVVSYKYKMEKLKDKLKAKDNWAGREYLISDKRSSITENILRKIFDRTPTSSNKEEAIEHFQELKTIIGTASRGKISDLMEPVSFDKGFFQSVSKLLAEKIEEPVLNDRDKRIIEIYSKNGQQYITEIKKTFENENQDICPYCFRSINSEERNLILLGIEKVLSEAAKEHQNKLNQCTKKISLVIDKLDKIMTIADKLKDIYTNEYDTFDSQYRVVNSLLSQYSQCLEDKMNSIYSPISLSDNNINQELQKLNSAISYLEEKRNDYNQQIDKINKSKEKASDWNNEIAYWEFSGDYNEYRKAYDDYNKCCETLKKHQKEFDDKKDEIDKLNNKKKNVVIAKDKINKALSYVYFSNNRLKLDVDAEAGKYYLISNGVKVTPDKVSTGERNIIALCYFFTQMLNNHNATDNYTDEYFIVIDDPISSFDMENQVGVITYLKYQLSKILQGNKNSKILLLSHDLATVYDFEKAGKEISKEMERDLCVENFELKDHQIDNTSHIDNHRQEYSLLMKEIYNFAVGNNSLLSDFTIGNSMRRLLEAYGTFLYREGMASLTTDDDILDLCDNHKNYFRNYMYRLVLHGESHFQERILSLKDTNFFESFTSDQLRDTAQKIICYLYLINPLHVEKHLNDKGHSTEDYSNVIKEWIQNIPEDSD